MQLRLGSLFSGFGGLDRAIERVFDARTVWVSDIEPGPCKVLAHRFPGVPNLGDITQIDWSTVEPVDIIAGGSPCQDISSAGRMAGMREGTRSNLWVEMREAIATLRPALVTWENVSAARSTAAASAMESDPGLLGDHPAGVPPLRALGRVLGDLASLGYDAQWYSLRAADVGAPHGRLRYFILAADTRGKSWLQRRLTTPGQAPQRWPLGELTGRDRAPVGLLPTPAACNPNDGEGPETWLARRERVKLTANNGNGMGMPLGIAVQLMPTTSVADTQGGRKSRSGARSGELLLNGIADQQAWEPYAAAIARWEQIVGPAPSPTKLGKKGRPKLNPAFAEWMMGAAPGWITDVPGVTDNEALQMVGNGVVQQQAETALRIMADRFAQWSTP